MTDNDDTNLDALVDTGWVAAHLDDPTVRLVEADIDTQLYAAGHIPGAVALDWRTDLQSQRIRDVVSGSELEALLAARGIASDTTVVFYGDRSNRYAACAYWLFKLYGHRDCRIMDGGRTKWEAEGRPFSHATPDYPHSDYQAEAADLAIRAFRDQTLAQIFAGLPLVDVRSREEYAGIPASGHPVRRPLGTDDDPHASAQRAGHIPTARNVPWTAAINADGTFRTATELREIYRQQGICPDQPVITYSRIGARSAHSWFVLHELLGYPQVRNYDGSWSEWGSLVRAPIAWEEFDGSHRETP